MKERITAVLLFVFSLTATVHVQAQSSRLPSDGPYVFYEDGTGSIHWVKKGKLDTKFFAEKKKRKQSLTVYPKHCKADSFLVKLKPSIDIQPSIYPDAEKMLVVSDIEGQYCAFIRLMKNCNVIDENKNWAFGKGRLVICGDLFDRGNEVTAYLWFLYKLEKEAKKKGGYVHVLLGNHDIMNLHGDIRYIHPKYHKSAKVMGMDYNSLFGQDTELGRWLRSKNIIEKIGDKLFVHAGIPLAATEKGMSVEEINTICRPYYDQPVKLIPESLHPFLGYKGLFWYRGFMKDTPEITAEVDKALAHFDAKQIFVGHSIVNKIKKMHDGKVVAVDVNHHKGVHEALLIEGEKLYRLDVNGDKHDIGF